MKKNTTKPTTSPAPATKVVTTKPAAPKKTAAAPKVKLVTAKPSIPTVAPAPVAVAAPSTPKAAPIAPKVVVSAPKETKAVAVQPVAPKRVVTTITARVDVGFGNALYTRGEGPGLSWDAGALMECVGNDLWRITLGESARGFTFKFLVNDLSWSTGPDYIAASGATVTLTPEF